MSHMLPNPKITRYFSSILVAKHKMVERQRKGKHVLLLGHHVTDKLYLTCAQMLPYAI